MVMLGPIKMHVTRPILGGFFPCVHRGLEPATLQKMAETWGGLSRLIPHTFAVGSSFQACGECDNGL